MCFDLMLWWTKIGSLTFANLANVQTVGIGLYLALAVIQAVSSSGISGLRRRLTTLNLAVRSARMRGEFESMHSLQQEIGALEIGFQAFNRTILLVVVALFVASICYFAYCTILQDAIASPLETLFILVFYLLAPIVIFAGAALRITRKCHGTAKAIASAEARYLQKALG